MSSEPSKSGAAANQTKQILRIAAMIVLALIMVGAVLLGLCSVRNERMRDKLYFAYSGQLQPDVHSIELDAQAQKERVKANKRHGQTAKFRYYFEEYFRMRASYADSAILFGNVSTNDCALVFYIFDENDVLLYRSGGITPGNYANAIRLPDPKPDGEYACRLYVAAFDLQTNDYIGAQYSDMTLIIGG